MGSDKEADGAEEKRKKNRGDATKDYKQKDIDEDLVRRILVMKTKVVL